MNTRRSPVSRRQSPTERIPVKTDHDRMSGNPLLPAVTDRILSTAIEYEYTIILPKEPLTIDGLGEVGKKAKFAEVATSARNVTLNLFATDESASVQVRNVFLFQLLPLLFPKSCLRLLSRRPCHPPGCSHRLTHSLASSARLLTRFTYT